MARGWLVLALLTTVTFAGCLDGGSDEGTDDPGPGAASGLVDAAFELYTLPAVFGQEPAGVSPRDLQGDGQIGLYEPTIDVGPDGVIYLSAHSSDVGLYPAPAYMSLDDGATWESMALASDYQGEPSETMSAPLFSDEVFIVAGEAGQAWGADCCTNEMAFPMVGWGSQGRTVDYYNQNAYDHSRLGLDSAEATASCVPAPGTDRPWLAYANGKLLMVNNPGLSVVSENGQIALQVGSMDVPPLAPVAYGAAAWGIDWNLCASRGGFIPGIPDMRDDHFFAVPQWVDFNTPGCGAETHYDVVTGNADDMYDLTQTTVFRNSHVRPAEDDGGPSEVGLYGQVVFDAAGRLYVAAMNNTVDPDATGCKADQGGIHFALSTDDATTFAETTFRFDRPVSSFYMDGNRHGDGLLLFWGEIDGNNTDWFIAHVLANDDGTLRMENRMLVMDDGPEASRHVQGAALGPDGRAYLAFSWNSQNPNGAKAEPGDTPLFVAVQQDGPTLSAA